MPAQLLKSAKPTPGSKSQQPPQGQQPSAPQAQQGSFSGHKEIKLTLLNKVGLPGGWDLGFPAPGDLRSGGGWIPAGMGLILAGRGWFPAGMGLIPGGKGWIPAGLGLILAGREWFPAKEELQARSCWAELSQEGLGLAWRAAHRTSLAAHTLWWLHFGTVLAAPLGHIPAAASRLFPSCSKVPRVPGPFPLGDALGATGQQAGDCQAHRAQGEKGTSASAPWSAHLALPLPSDPVCRSQPAARVGELGLVGFGAGAGCWPRHVGRFLFLIFCSASPNSPAQSEAADFSTSLCSDVRRLYQRQEAALEGGVCSDT